jgi:hypothetical protein
MIGMNSIRSGEQADLVFSGLFLKVSGRADGFALNEFIFSTFHHRTRL